MGTRVRGIFSFSKENIPLTPPRERTRGAPLAPRHWQSRFRRAARAAQCGCGVHGFAMSPFESLPVATAPYCREARVTFAWRQTACGMRHCFARRIVECSGRRKLGSTSTRWAERQRVVGAEANRLAVLTRQRRAMGSAIGKHCSSSSCSLAMAKPFSWGIKRGPFSFVKENGPL